MKRNRESLLCGLSCVALETKHRRGISINEATARLLDTMNIQDVSERILLVEEVRNRIDRREMILNIIAGMTEMAGETYREGKKKSIPAAVDETIEKYELLLKTNKLEGEKWKSFFHRRACQRLARRSQAVQRQRKRTAKTQPKKKSKAAHHKKTAR